MLRILASIAALCLVAAVQGGPANASDQPRSRSAPQAVLAGLAGTWQGVYSYPGQDRDPVAFTLALEVRGGTCRGRTEEANTFGSPSVRRLYANVECQVIDGTVSPRLMLKKTYDGTGGQTHSVDYLGDLSPDGKSVTGSWRVGAQSGRFSLTKQ
jgi:hypothetical protein